MGLMQPGVMYGEDVDPNTGVPIRKKYPKGYQPGVMYGEDVDPNTGKSLSQSSSKPKRSSQGHGEIYYQPGVGYFNRTTGAMVPGGGNLPKTTKADEKAAGIIAESSRKGAGFSTGGVDSAADLEAADKGDPEILPAGPQRSAPAPNGSGASGTQTGFQGYKIDLGIAEESLGRKIADVNSFLSESLPVVGYRDQSGREIRPTGDDLSELQGSFADGLISSDQLIFEGISTPGKGGVSPADVADNKRSVRIPGDIDDMDPMFEATGGGDDDDFGGPDPADYATNYSARRKAQRDAFLNPNITNSVEAVRAANNAIGRAKFGNKHYFNDGGTLREVTKEAYEKQGSTGLSADEIKGAYVDSIKETLVPVATADAFDVSGDTETFSKQTTADYMGDIAKTEFNMNNVAPNASGRAEMKDKYFSALYDDDED